MLNRILSATLLCGLVACGGAASADTITIGNGSGASNIFPFGGGVLSYLGEYQQVFDGSQFSGPIDITALSFFVDPAGGGTGATGTFALSLSTTSKTVLGLSSNYASNIGADNSIFFSGTVNNVTTFTGGPFLFDPSQGNLLLNVFVTTNNPLVTPFLAGCGAITNRVYNSGGTGTPTVDSCNGGLGYGLETEFTFTAANNNSSAGVPEPITLSLFSASVAGAVTMRRRKKA